MAIDVENTKKEGLKKLQNLKNIDDALYSLKKENKLNTLMSSLEPPTNEEDSNMLDYFLDLLQVSGGPEVMQKLRAKTAKLTAPIAEECKEIIFEELIQFINCNLDFVIPSNDSLVNGVPTVDTNLIVLPVTSIDPFKLLQTSPSSTPGKALYEKLTPQPNQLPYSTNQELFYRLQTPNTPLIYKGASGNDLFSIEFDLPTQSYRIKPIGLDGSFNDNTLLADNDRKITTFLRDYFDSIKIFEGQNFLGNLLDALFGFLDVQLKMSEEEVEVKGKFGKLIEKILGLCGDDGDGSSGAPITASGIGHLSEDGVSLEPDSPFWDFGPQELRNLQDETSLKLNGLLRFLTCEELEGKADISQLNTHVLSILNENNSTVEGVKLNNAIGEIINGMSVGDDTNMGFKLPQLQVELDVNILKKLPNILMSLILTPKVLLGIGIALTTVGEFFQTNDSVELLKKLSRLMVKIVKRIFQLVIELIWDEVKKEIIKLIKKIMAEVLAEKHTKQLEIISSLIQTLLAAAELIDDLRNCRSILDTLLQYLKIPPIPSVDIPKNLLFATAKRPGFSDVRALQNVIKNFSESGINIEPMPDGSPNVNVKMAYSLIKGVEEERSKNAVVKIATYAQNVQTSGGPGVTETGTGTGLII